MTKFSYGFSTNSIAYQSRKNTNSKEEHLEIVFAMDLQSFQLEHLVLMHNCQSFSFSASTIPFLSSRLRLFFHQNCTQLNRLLIFSLSSIQFVTQLFSLCPMTCCFDGLIEKIEEKLVIFSSAPNSGLKFRRALKFGQMIMSSV
jgi:hypothetical protein